MSTRKLLLWQGTFEHVNSAAPSATQLQTIGPKVDKVRPREDDDNDDKTTEELEQDIKRKRAERVSILKQKIATETAEKKKLEELIRKDAADLENLEILSGPDDDKRKALAYFMEYRERYKGNPKIRLQAVRENYRQFHILANVLMTFEDSRYAPQFQKYMKSTKIALLLHQSSGYDYPIEAIRLIEGVPSPVPSAKTIEMLKRAGATIDVTIFKKYYMGGGFDDDRESHEGYETLRIAWGYNEKKGEIKR